MKPPVRHRIRSVRLRSLKKTETKHRVCTTWYKKEQRGLRQGLSLQLNSNSEPNLLELQKKVPKRTLLEIQHMLKFLKSSVVRRVHDCVQNQKLEEERIKVPIEIWDDLAQKMAAGHEETISSAFSQMLVIAATEPLSQLHSVPPCQSASLNAIQGMENTTLSPSSQKASSLVDPTVSPSPKKITTGTQSSSVAGQVLTKVSKPTAPKTKLGQTSVNQSETVSNILPPATTSGAAPISPNSTKQNEHFAQGKSKQDLQQRSAEKASTVNFGRIYQFISNINRRKKRSVLTAMESAVLLDLVMSLPEELPLLDCKELQHHLLQVYSSLTSESTISIPATVQRSAAAKPAGAEQHDQGHNIFPQTAEGKDVQTGVNSSEGSEQTNAPELAEDISDHTSVNPPKESITWSTSGLFPLNPFMFPVSLLKRQQP